MAADTPPGVTRSLARLFMGVLWFKYRNLTAIVVAYVTVNGWAVAAELVSS